MKELDGKKNEKCFNTDSIFDGKVSYVHIPTERALDIDTPFDLRIAELLLSNE